MHVFLNIRNLRWDREDRTLATGQVIIEGQESEGWQPFSFDRAEPELLGNEDARAALFADFEAGKHGPVAPYVAPPPPPYVPIAISAEILFFERMTDDEYDALDDSIRSGESARVYRGWAAASSFTEGTDLWALLVKHLDRIVPVARRDELLARP